MKQKFLVTVFVVKGMTKRMSLGSSAGEAKRSLKVGKTTHKIKIDYIRNCFLGRSLC